MAADRGDDDGVYVAEAEEHEGAVGFGEVGEGFVGVTAEQMEVSDERQRRRPRREVLGPTNCLDSMA